MKTNQAGIDLIKEFEGLHTHAYKCPAGKWTIGYGWTIGVKSTDVWTPEHAEEMLVKGLQQYENAVTSAIANVATENQFSAMVSLAYNIGPGNFINSSVLVNHMLDKFEEAADCFLLWDKAGGRVLDGLVRRRNAERDLYLTP